MDFVKLMKTAIVSILFISRSTLAGNSCDYTVPSIKLCSAEHCPNDYHLCNSFDRQTIIQSIANNDFNNITETYYTYIQNNGETCEVSSNHNVIAISNITSFLWLYYSP